MKTSYRKAIILGLLLFVSLSTYASTPTEDKLVIEYQRSGGIAGLDETYSVFMHGQIVLNGNPDGQAEIHEVEALLQQIEALGFYDLTHKYVPQDPCCDRFFYQLKVSNGTGEHIVDTVDGAPTAPAQLWEVLTLVKDFVEKERTTSP